jgi:CBS domain-containing protein
MDPLDSPARDHMTRVLTALSPNTSVAAARQLLADQHLSGAPVVDEQGRLLGVVTLQDLHRTPADPTPGVARYRVLHEGQPLTEAAIPGASSEGGRVEGVMTRDVLALPTDALLREAVRIMVTREVHRLLVVDGDRLVGLLSTMDILRALVPDRPASPDQGF